MLLVTTDGTLTGNGAATSLGVNQATSISPASNDATGAIGSSLESAKADFTQADTTLLGTGAGIYVELKHNLSATAAPVVTNDSSQGYAVNSEWVDITNDNVYKCVDAIVDSAVWKQLDATASTPATAILLDSSAGDDNKTLPSATGSGNILFYANKDVSANNAYLVPQVGESINGVTYTGSNLTSMFKFHTYSNGTQFIATDVGTGQWVIAVEGTSTQDTGLYLRLEGALINVDSNNTDESFEVFDLNGLITETGVAGYDVDISNNVLPTGVTISTNGALNGFSAGWYDVRAFVTHPTLNATGGTGSQQDVGFFKALLLIAEDATAAAIEAAYTTASVLNGIYNHNDADTIEASSLSGRVYITPNDYVYLGYRSAVNDVNLEDYALKEFRIDPVVDEKVVLAGMATPTDLANVVYSLSADSAASLVCPFDVGQGDTTVITNSGGTITLPAGKYRIVAHASRQAANLDYELYDVTNSTVLEKYSTASDIGVTSPYYLTVTTPTQIQIREGDISTAVVWNGRQLGFDAGFDNAQKQWGTYIDIQQLSNSTVVMPDALDVEDVEVLLGSGTNIPNNSTLALSENWSSIVTNYDEVKILVKSIVSGEEFTQIVSSKTSAFDGTENKRLEIFSDGTNSVGVKVTTGDFASNTITVVELGAFGNVDLEVYGVKAQKTVINVNETTQYSTTETATSSTWIDGKTIYQRTFTNTDMANNAVLLSGVDTVVKVEDMASAGSGTTLNSENYTWSAGSNYSHINFNTSTNEVIWVSSDATQAISKAHVTIQYTKL